MTPAAATGVKALTVGIADSAHLRLAPPLQCADTGGHTGGGAIPPPAHTHTQPTTPTRAPTPGPNSHKGAAQVADFGCI